MANSYLSRSVSSAGNRKTFTLSAWVKRGIISSGEHNIFGNSDSSYNNGFVVKFNSSDQLRVIMQDSSNYEKKPNRLFRDPSGWYHLVIQVDTTQSTATDRVKIWVNGVQETSFATDTMPSQNYDTHWNNTTQITTVGRAGNYNGDYYDGYITHAANVDGAVVAPTVFGETDSTSGIWKFKSPSGVTWGTNGFHLKMENSGNMGLDSSGQTNNFTTNGNLKQALDTPSNVHATINTLIKPGPDIKTVINGNLSQNASSSNAWASLYSTLAVSSGKWYCEFKVDGTYVSDQNNLIFGVRDVDNLNQSSHDKISQTAHGFGYRAQSGSKETGNSQSSYGNSYTTGDVIGLAMDLDNQKLYFHKNGTYQNSGDPTSGSTGTGAAFTLSSGVSYVVGASSYYTQDHYSFNFGNGFFGTTAISSAGSNGNGSLFEYDVPSGYYALNTKNINTYG